MRILFVSAELAPLVQSGGLGDAVHGLALALRSRGHAVTCAVPGYRVASRSAACPPLAEAGSVRLPLPDGEIRGRWLAGSLEGGVGLRLLDVPELYDRDGVYGDRSGPYPDGALRFIAFSRAAAALGVAERCDVLVAHDWHAALAASLLRSGPDAGGARLIGVVQAVHNNAYQGRFAREAMALTGLPAELFGPDGVEFYGDLCLLKAGLIAADRVVTVSPNYAREIQTAAFGEGLQGVYRQRADRLSGIANGLDTARFDPATDGALDARYGARDPSGKDACRRAILGELGLDPPAAGRFCTSIGRFAYQKGWDVLAEALDLMIEAGASVAVLGDGDADLVARLRDAARRHPRRMHVSVGWDDRLARRLYAGADCTLIPSRFEPCGLVQLLSQRYGALPVAHRVGGLVDTIADGESGVLFDPLSPATLAAAVERAAALVARSGGQELRRRLLELDVSWSRPAVAWEALLASAVEEARGRP